MEIVSQAYFFGQFYGGQLRLVASEALSFFSKSLSFFGKCLSLFGKSLSFFTTSLILGGLSGYNPFIYCWKKNYPPCNCQLIPSALGNVYLLKSFALSFLYEASKNPDILSFSAKNGLEFF